MPADAHPRRERERLITIGSVPPDLGGRSTGGVATRHATVLRALAGPDAPARVAGTIGLNLATAPAGAPVAVPGQINPPAAGRRAAEQIRALAAAGGARAVLLFHLANRYGAALDWRAAGLRAVASIASWHALAPASADRAAAAGAYLDVALPRIDALVFPSRHTYEEGRALGLAYASPCHVISNPIDPQWAAWGAVREPRDGIVFVGSLEARKRPDAVLRCAARLRLAVTFVGSGPLEDALRTEADALGARACFLGSLPPAAVAAQIRRARALVVPSRSESFGNVYLEAAACGTPSVGFAPTLAEISTTAGTPLGAGVAPDASDDELAAAIEAALALELDRRAVAAAIAGPFAARRIVEAYVDVALGRTAAASTQVDPGLVLGPGQPR